MLFGKHLKNIFVVAHLSNANSVARGELAVYSPDQSNEMGDTSPVSLNADAGTYTKYNQQAVMDFLGNEVEWCILSSLSARTCADQLVNSLENQFGGDWGCVTTAPGYGAAHTYYSHFDSNNKYYVSCHPRSNTAVLKADLEFMCEKAAYACRTADRIDLCMRDLLKTYPTFCPTSDFNLMIARSYHDSAWDRWTASYGHIAKGGSSYECLAA